MEKPENQQLNVNIDWAQTEELTCDECKSPYFEPVSSFRKISKFLVGGDRDQLFPLQVIRCADCGHVNEDLKPVLPGQEKE